MSEENQGIGFRGMGLVFIVVNRSVCFLQLLDPFLNFSISQFLNSHHWPLVLSHCLFWQLGIKKACAILFAFQITGKANSMA